MLMTVDEVNELSTDILRKALAGTLPKTAPYERQDQWQRRVLPTMTDEELKKYFECPYWSDGDVIFCMQEVLRRL